MKQTYRPLILLNALLLGVLALVTLAPGVSAQQPRRAKGQYALIDAKIQGSPEAAIFIVDSANQELLAVRWDRSRKALNSLGYRDMRRDEEMRTRGGR